MHPDWSNLTWFKAFFGVWYSAAKNTKTCGHITKSETKSLIDPKLRCWTSEESWQSHKNWPYSNRRITSTHSIDCKYWTSSLSFIPFSSHQMCPRNRRGQKKQNIKLLTIMSNRNWSQEPVLCSTWKETVNLLIY